jgi:hypothetical protein
MCSTSWKRTFLEGSFLSSISLALNKTSQNKRVQRQGAAAGWPGKSHGACLGSHLPGVAGASRWPAASAPTAARGEATAGVIDLLRTNPDLANVRHSRRRAISRPKALCVMKGSLLFACCASISKRESPAVARAELALASWCSSAARPWTNGGDISRRSESRAATG